MPQANTVSSECQHCHQAILRPIEGEGGAMYCCYGCRVVAEMLASSSSSSYLKEALPLRRYAYLDEATVRRKVLEFEESGQARVRLHLPAIHCSSCIYLLENLPQVEPAILRTEVHFGRKEAALHFRSDEISLSQVAALLDYIGYPPDFHSRLGGKSAPRKTLLLRLGVAGFFFGNTMLLALPEYLHADLGLHAGLQHFFRYLMLFFSLPVLLYSAQPYFRQAFKALRMGGLSIDLPIALGLLVLFGRSTYEVLAQVGSGYFDSLTGLVFFLLIGKWYQDKTYRNFSFDRDLQSFLPLAASRIGPDGQEVPVAIEHLEENDQLRLRAGEVLPADAVLVQERASLDYSYLTGESLPLEKKKGQTVFAGARLEGAPADFLLTGPSDQSYLSSLWAQDGGEAASARAPSSLSDQISRYFTPAILAIALLAGLFWWSSGPGLALQVVTAVLIVACPCALALAEPFTQGSLMRVMGRYGLFLKNSGVINRLMQINHLVLDKTGTLTRTDDIQVSWQGGQLSAELRRAVATVAYQAQHPLARPLGNFLETSPEGQGSSYFSEQTGEGVAAQVEQFYLRLGKASYVNTPEQTRRTAVYLEVDGQLLGYFEFQQELRASLRELASQLQEQYQLSLLSGDSDGERERFQTILGSGAQLFFRQTPHDKLAYLRQLQEQGQQVLMLGDGLNDAGALRQSNVGISLCETNVHYFPASDAVLQSPSLPYLSHFLSLAHYSRRVIKAAFGLSLAYNLVGISFALAGMLSPLVAAILMPLSSVSVVMLTTLSIRQGARRRMSGKEAS